MHEITTQKRPASHRWAIGIFGFMTTALAIMLLDFSLGRSGASIGPHWILILLLSIGALAMFALVLGGRCRWGYYISSAAIGIWCARGLYTVPSFFYSFITQGGAVSTPYYHLGQRDMPMVVQENVSFPKMLLMAVLLGLLIWLFVRFTFGGPSRHFYGFDDVEKYDAS